MAIDHLTSSPRVLVIGGDDHALRVPFLQRLREKGIEAMAAGTGDDKAFETVGIPHYRYAFNRFAGPLADRHAIIELRKIIERTGPDLVQSFDTKPNILLPLAARALSKRLPVVRTINGMGWVYSSRSPLAFALRPAYWVLQRYAGQYTSATVFQNRDDLVQFDRGDMIGHGRRQVIAGSGVDIETFDKAANAVDSATLRRSLGLDGVPVVMTVSRLTRQKGIATLLRAAAIVHKVRPEVRFVLVGPRESEGPFAISSAQLAAHEPYVTTLGRRSDVAALLRIADVFAFPTQYREGVPRVLLEAAASGVPIVATRMPGCTDVVKNRWSGLLVEPRSHIELAEAVLELLADRQRSALMADRARSLVREDFTLDKVVDRYVTLYRELLGPSAELSRAAGPECSSRFLNPLVT